MLKKLHIIPALSALLLFASCSTYQSVLKGSDFKKKYEYAKRYYEEKNYSKALPLLEETMVYVRGQKDAEDVYYMYAMCYAGVKDYQTAYYYLSNFTSTYPLSKYAEEAAYMGGYCLAQDSPRSQLDQSSTIGAIAELQSFVNRYPNSSRVNACNELIETLRKKLEVKSFNSALLWYNIEYYNSAIVAFKTFLNSFPDSRLDAEASYYLVLSAYKYAQNSVDEKKKERYEEAIKYYYNFADRFKESARLKEAEAIFNLCQKEKDKLNQN